MDHQSNPPKSEDPTTNGGAQKLEARSELVRVALSRLSHVWAPTWRAQSVLIGKKFMRRSSVGKFIRSVLLVGENCGGKGG